MLAVAARRARRRRRAASRVPAGGPTGSGAPRAGVVAFVLLVLRPARRRRAAAACSAGATGTSWRRAWRRGSARRRPSRCPTAASTSGCASRSSPAGRRCSALAALLAFWPRARRDAGLPVAGGGRPRRALRGPDRRARSRLAATSTARCSASLLAGFLWLERVRADQLARRRAPAWWPPRSSGRSSRRAWTAAGRGSTTRTFAEELEPTQGRGVLAGTTATGR